MNTHAALAMLAGFIGTPIVILGAMALFNFWRNRRAPQTAANCLAQERMWNNFFRTVDAYHRGEIDSIACPDQRGDIAENLTMLSLSILPDRLAPGAVIHAGEPLPLAPRRHKGSAL